MNTFFLTILRCGLLCVQNKVNTGYEANMKELTASTGIPAFLAPTGLGWQVVKDLVDAAKSSNSPAPSPATSAASAALTQTQQQEENDKLTVLTQLDSSGQDAAVSPAASPAANHGVSLQVRQLVTRKGSSLGRDGLSFLRSWCLTGDLIGCVAHDWYAYAGGVPNDYPDLQAPRSNG